MIPTCFLLSKSIFIFDVWTMIIHFVIILLSKLLFLTKLWLTLIFSGCQEGCPVHQFPTCSPASVKKIWIWFYSGYYGKGKNLEIIFLIQMCVCVQYRYTVWSTLYLISLADWVGLPIRLHGKSSSLRYFQH